MQEGAESVAVVPASSTGRVGLVLAGGGARGAYEMGALSVLLPELAKRGELPSVIVGTSAGALNGAWIAANIDSRVDELAAGGLELWSGLRWQDVVAPVWSLRSFAPLLRLLAGSVSHRIRVEYLLDARPLIETIERRLSVDRLQANLSSGLLHAVGVVATRASAGTSVVFYDGGPASVETDDGRGIEYVRGRLRRDHVAASAALPAVFRPVEIRESGSANGWYVDGGTRLNTPIKPALKLEADRLVVIALNSTRAATPGRAHGRCPDIFDGAGQIMQALLADPIARDVRTLAMINTLASRAAGDARVVPYLLIEPSEPDRLGAIAREVFETYYGRWSRILTSVGAAGRLLHADASRGSGELFSYFFFAPEFTDALIAEGKRDAEAWLDRPHEAGLWQHGPL